MTDLKAKVPVTPGFLSVCRHHGLRGEYPDCFHDPTVRHPGCREVPLPTTGGIAS